VSGYEGTEVTGQCPMCGGPVHAQPGKGRPRRFCSLRCKQQILNRGPRPPVERFMAKVEKTESGCWLYNLRNKTNVYGVFWLGDKPQPAHRWAYEHFVGPIPDGMWIDHLCRTQRCVNPEHLEPVTPSENRRRAVWVRDQ
jgi:hypothetical protein